VSIDPNEFLMGSMAKAAQFPTLGTTVTGRISERPEVKQQTDLDDGSLRFFDNGDPMMQLLVTAKTDQRDPQDPEDDGERIFYVKANMLAAVKAAVKAAGANGLDVGGVLSVTYVGDGEAKRRGHNAPKKYTATYRPPTGNPAADALLRSPEQAPQPTPAPLPTPAPQPAAATAGTPAGIDLSALDPATRALVEQQMSQAGSPVPF